MTSAAPVMERPAQAVVEIDFDALSTGKQSSDTPYERTRGEIKRTNLLAEERQIAAAKRDSREFGPLYERYVDEIYRYVYRRVGNHHETEDLTAQTFQQALAALPTYEWRGLPFGAWLYRIAGNLIIRHRKVRGREIAVDHVERIVDERSSGGDPSDVLLQKALSDQLLSAVRMLTSDQQRALVLKYSHGLTNQQVGEILGRTEGGVKQLVHRAMLTLRARLEQKQIG